MLSRADQAGVGEIIITGTSVKVSAQAVQMCRKSLEETGSRRLTCTVGVHPHDALKCNESTIESLRDLALANREVVVAVGETGLDYNRNFSPREVLEYPASDAVGSSTLTNILTGHLASCVDSFTHMCKPCQTWINMHHVFRS
eukprot:m.244895 g.244895  ORF g.244895 m.244895 type:complete len:143 (-) comp19477_c0_seq18:1372-1800(-)